MANIDGSPTPLALMERADERRGRWEDTDVAWGERRIFLSGFRCTVPIVQLSLKSMLDGWQRQEVLERGYEMTSWGSECRYANIRLGKINTVIFLGYILINNLNIQICIDLRERKSNIKILFIK